MRRDQVFAGIAQGSNAPEIVGPAKFNFKPSTAFHGLAVAAFRSALGSSAFSAPNTPAARSSN